MIKTKKKHIVIFVLSFGLILAFGLILDFGEPKVSTLKNYDVCIYGGTSAGVIAAYTAKKMGKTVILIEPSHRLGGMTSGGLGLTDIGNKYAISGLAHDFYRRVGQYYGKFEQWVFEPKVAKSIFLDYIKEGSIDVEYNTRLNSVEKKEGLINTITLESSLNPNPTSNTTIKAKMYLDCTYEGDLMAKAGVRYTIGRESNSEYNETLNGVQLAEANSIYHQFPDGVDPYIIPGDPKSGLLWGISDEELKPTGTGDKKVQAYCFRLCLTNNPDNMIPITKPEGYDSSRYDLLARFFPVQLEKTIWWKHFKPMPNNKTDINSTGGLSTDMIGANYKYPDGSYEERKKIIKEHELYTKGLLYFHGHDSRVPEEMRREMLKWGYPKDEYLENGHFSPQLYIREARRMIGEYVMTQHNCQGRAVVNDGIGMAAYGMDSHNCQRVVVNGMVKNEGDVQVGGFPPYPISYRSITPKQDDCKNLLVPVCLSATHIAYGSIRMEPVFMVLGQSAAVAAVFAINEDLPVQKVDIKKVQQFLKNDPLADGTTPDILVDSKDKDNLIIKGEWSIKLGGTYGPDALFSVKNDEPKSIQFNANISKTGLYDVYSYISPKLDNTSSNIEFTVGNGKEDKIVTIKNSQVKVKGQTEGEWVHLGEFNFSSDSEVYTIISNEGADGTIVADAVLWVPSFK